MSIELKIKSKHLSLEAKVIRFEENKLKRQIDYIETPSNRKDVGIAEALRETWHSLNLHRRWDVRNENRSTFLARAYIAGKEYKSVEKKRNNNILFHLYIVPRITSMVIKYQLKKHEKSMKLEEVKIVRDQIIEWSK